MLRMKLLAATAALALLVNVAPAHAAATTGNFGMFLGVFAGNDSAALVSSIVGASVTALGKVDPPANATNGGLTLTNTTNLDNGTLASGDWSTTPAIGWLAVKDGSTNCTVATGCALGSLGEIAGLSYTGGTNAFALYAYSNQTSGSWSGVKFFNDNGSKAISHITAYVPLPAALGLMLTALAGLFGFKRLKQHQEKDAIGTAQAA